MSLPFLKPRKIAAAIIATRNAEGIVPLKEEGEEAEELMSAAEDLLSAIAMKDAKKVAQALKAAIEMCSYDEEMPEEAGE